MSVKNLQFERIWLRAGGSPSAVGSAWSLTSALVEYLNAAAPCARVTCTYCLGVSPCALLQLPWFINRQRAAGRC